MAGGDERVKIPPRRRRLQRGRSFEKQNFFGTCNPDERRNPTWSSIGPGRAAFTSDTRTARVEEQGARARVPREGVSPGAVSDDAAAARDTPPRLFGSSAPSLGVRPRRLRVPSAPFPSPSLTPCPSPSPRKERWLRLPLSSSSSSVTAVPVRALDSPARPKRQEARPSGSFSRSDRRLAAPRRRAGRRDRERSR